MSVQVLSLMDIQAATVEDIKLVHDPRYIEGLEALIRNSPKGKLEPSTYYTSSSYTDALMVAASCQNLSERAMYQLLPRMVFEGGDNRQLEKYGARTWYCWDRRLLGIVLPDFLPNIGQEVYILC
jgi:hypothetical protein